MPVLKGKVSFAPIIGHQVFRPTVLKADVDGLSLVYGRASYSDSLQNASYCPPR